MLLFLKMMDHLSHEIQTPVAVLMSALALLKRPLASLPEEKWQRAMARAERSLGRLVALQGELEDILKHSQHRNHHILCRLLDQCADELEILIAEEAGEGPVVDKVRNRIEEIFGSREAVAEKIAINSLHSLISDIMVSSDLKSFAFRKIRRQLKDSLISFRQTFIL